MLIALVVVVAAVALAVLGNGGTLPEAGPDRLDDPLPADRPVHPADLTRLRLAVSLRGYRMSDVDDVLDRVGAELAEREARIAELEAALASSPAAPGHRAGPGRGSAPGQGPGGAVYDGGPYGRQQPPAPPQRPPAYGPPPAAPPFGGAPRGQRYGAPAPGGGPAAPGPGPAAGDQDRTDFDPWRRGE